MDSESEGHRATHTPAHDKGRFDLQVIQETSRLLDLREPAEPLHTASGPSRLSPVIYEDRVLRCERL